MKKNKFILTVIIMFLFVLLESSLLKKLPNRFIYPDIALLILVFFSNNKGALEGGAAGFLIGMAEDVLSLSPLGFNSFIKTFIGYILGKLKGKIFIDPVFFPVLMIFAATLLKGALAALISVLFLKPDSSPAVFSVVFAIEIVENCIAAPFIFALMKLLRIYTVDERSF